VTLSSFFHPAGVMDETSGNTDGLTSATSASSSLSAGSEWEDADESD
jgi:hypothetical protein